MSLTETLIISALAVWADVTAIWLLSLALKNASIIDIFWGLGFVLLATLYHVTLDGFGGRNVLITSLVLVWGLRLGLHIFWRNRGHGEDYRYQKWRERAGEKFWWTSYFRVFLLQGMLLWVISMPLLAAIINQDPDHFTALDVLGAAVWAMGFFFEAVGDWQLARFKADPANEGKVMDRGIWRYTRHPNYFGDATLWWGYFLIAAGTTDGWLTLFSPIIMTVLLVRISGAALLERGLKKTKPGYPEYVEGTSGFIPWLPARKP
jgi:steroid 5-alpha reductase family enzyme